MVTQHRGDVVHFPDSPERLVTLRHIAAARGIEHHFLKKVNIVGQDEDLLDAAGFSARFFEGLLDKRTDYE